LLFEIAEDKAGSELLALNFGGRIGLSMAGNMLEAFLSSGIGEVVLGGSVDADFFSAMLP